MFAAALLALDPVGLGGAVLRGGGGPARDAWLDTLRAMAPERVIRKLPPGVDAASLNGGLDIAATLSAGRPIAERGLLAAAHGGILVVPMAERLDAAVIGPLAAALDTGEATAILLDEGSGEEGAPATLVERVAFRLDLDGLRPDAPSPIDPATIARARDLLPHVDGGDAVEPLCLAGIAFGVPSLRVASFALRAAKAAAALDGRLAVSGEDVERAAALVIAPRATRLPSREEAAGADEGETPSEASTIPPSPAPGEPSEPDAAEPGPAEGDLEAGAAMADRVIEATRAAIPAGLLAALGLAAAGPARPGLGGGRTGLARQPAKRGRPAGVRRGAPGHGARLAIVATLRAAAPWQAVRRRSVPPERAAAGILVRREDFRVARFKRRREAATLFVVDASGSAALHRLAEVKGAVELILADCYVRRDSVALIAFRGERAEVLLAPTRSLARAKRALAGQPGGGGTPLAGAIDAAARLADGVRRRGQVPLAVFLTDGRANVDRAGRPGRRGGEADALAAARAFRLAGCASLVLDVAPRPGEAARALAGAMGARYVALPYADAASLSRAVLDG